MPKRILRWGNAHPFAMAGLMNLVLVMVMGAGILHEGDVRAREIKAEAEARAVEVLAASERACEKAVRGVTNAAKADDLKTVDVLKARSVELGRPVPGVYLALEEAIAGRQPNLEACRQEVPTTP